MLGVTGISGKGNHAPYQQADAPLSLCTSLFSIGTSTAVKSSTRAQFFLIHPLLSFAPLRFYQDGFYFI